jgi:hypothetical protein
MKPMIKKTYFAIISFLSTLAILSFSSAKGEDAAPQKQAPHEFLAVLIDAASKKPVPSDRIILARKKEGKDERGRNECVIDTSLTGVSNERGEVQIPNVEPGEYVVFQIPSGIIKPEMKGRVVTWGGSATSYNLSLGSVMVKKGALVIIDGNMVISNGYMEAYVFPESVTLGISTTALGTFLTVHVPSTGSAPAKIEINTTLDIAK